MIETCSCKETEKVLQGIRSHRLPSDIQQIAFRKLRMLNNTSTLKDLRIPPNNHLEALKGTLKGSYSIRINDQWRICFVWKNGHASNVAILDYHK